MTKICCADLRHSSFIGSLVVYTFRRKMVVGHAKRPNQGRLIVQCTLRIDRRQVYHYHCAKSFIGRCLKGLLGWLAAGDNLIAHLSYRIFGY